MRRCDCLCSLRPLTCLLHTGARLRILQLPKGYRVLPHLFVLLVAKKET